jgi:hypothetical protein
MPDGESESGSEADSVVAAGDAALEEQQIPAAAGSLCIACGNRLEPGDEFCIKCGVPRAGSADQPTAVSETVVAPTPRPLETAPAAGPEQRRERKRSLLPLWIAVATIAILAAAWFVWQMIDGDDGTANTDAADSGATQSTVGDSGETATAGDDSETDAEAAMDVDCRAVADAAVEATVALIGSFSATSLHDAAAAARVGRQSMPGASEFDATHADLMAAQDEAGCAPSDQEALYSQSMAGVTAPADIVGRVVHSSALSGYGFGDVDLLTRATAVLRLYPAHGTIDLAESVSSGLPKWTVILESLEVAEYSQAEATANLSIYADFDVETGVFLSDDYGSLNPGYWVIYAGMFDTRDEAAALCSSIRGSVDFCYERYLQDLPTVTGPNGDCGPYGRFDVVGVATGTRLNVYVGPSSGQQVLGAFGSSATGVLSAGPEIRVGSTTWLPVEINGKIGWAESSYLSIDSACVGATPPPPTATSCPAVAVGTADLLQSIVSAAEVAETAGITAVSSLDMSSFDAQAESLVSDAGADRCNVSELNNLVAAQYGAIQAEGDFAEVVRELLTAQGFFEG